MQKITITFDGRNVQIKTEGFAGATCTAATAEVEKALGVKRSDKKTPEFYATQTGAMKVTR